MDSEGLLCYLDQLPVIGIYIILFFSSILENLFPPWPGDTLIVLSGFLAARDQGNILICLITVTAGNIAGASLMYYLGGHVLVFFVHLNQKFKNRFFNRILMPLVSQKSIEKTKFWFQRWGIGLVLFSRFSAGIRFFVSVVAGIVGMNFSLFLLCFTIGVLFWSSLLLGGGWLLKENWNIIIHWMKIYNILIGTCIALFFLAWFLFQKRKNKSDQASDL